MPKNAVLVMGTRGTISEVAVQPPYFNPMTGNQNVSFSFTTYGSQTATVTITFLNTESLSVVRTITIPSQAQGVVNVLWDGRSDSGSRVASGTYLVTATVTDPLGNTAKSQILSTVAY